MKNEFSAVDGALNGWYTDIQQGGEQSYEDGLYRGEVSAYAYNSAPAFGSETDYSGATAFYQGQRESAYAGLGLGLGAPSGGLQDYAGWSAAGFVNGSWQGVQFIGMAGTLGVFSNPFDGSSYHSLIGDGTLFGSPQSFTGAMGVKQGEVASYFAGLEGLAVLGLKGAKYFGKADEVPEVKSSLDKNLFDAGGESDFYNKADDKVLSSLGRIDFYVKSDGTTIPGTGYRYLNSDAPYLTTLNNSKLIPANQDGTYFSFDKYDQVTVASDKLQVPHNASIRVQFDTKQILDDVRVPFGAWGTATHLEPITKDFPIYGAGGATQAITNKPIIIDKIEDLRLRNNGGD